MGFRGYATGGVVLLSSFFQNCAPAFQGIDAVEKQNLLREQSVFRGDAFYVHVHSKKLRAVEDTSLNGGTEGSIPATGPNGELVIPLIDSTMMLPGAGSIPVGESAYGEVTMQNGVIVPANWYVPPPVVTVTTSTNQETDNSALLGIMGGLMGAMTGILSSGNSSSSNSGYQEYVSTSGSTSNGMPSTSSTTHSCIPPNAPVGKEYVCSPIMIAFGGTMENRRTFSLTNPRQDGRLFDIAGEKTTPPHTPKNISWFYNDQYMFVVKPNAAGRVDGINEMFGDSTRGPDGKFAANGYVALARWDANGDRLITSNDPVFRELRLWRDRNADAIAQADELLTFEEMGLEVLDLRYDNRYIEMDEHGNFTTFKSVAKDRDGRLHLMFDLWFVVRN